MAQPPASDASYTVVKPGHLRRFTVARLLRIALVLVLVWVAVTMLGLAMADNIGLSEKGRRAYVISATIVVVLWGLWRVFLRPRVDEIVGSDNRSRPRRGPN